MQTCCKGRAGASQDDGPTVFQRALAGATDKWEEPHIRPETGNSRVRHYLGERYLAGADERAALDRAGRLWRAVAAAPARGLRLLSTTYVTNEEWVFDVFEAESAEQVRDLYALGGVAVERVIAAVHLTEPPDLGT